MPSFILRDLNPAFWSRVQAKARAEGTTVKAVILQLLTTWLGVVALALFTVSCTSPYEPTPLPHDPIVVTPTPSPGTTPSASDQPLLVSLSIGMGSPHVGDPISFVATTGTTITRADWSFGNGVTQQTIRGETAYAYPAVGTFTARVTVTASDGRTASDQATVTVQKQPTAPKDPTTPPPADPTLSAVLTCTAHTSGSPTPCNVSASYGGAPLGSSQITQVDWEWGDGKSESTTFPGKAHTFTMTGTYTVIVTVSATTPDGARVTRTNQTLTIP